MTCPLCGGAGWTLDCHPDQEPRCLELLPCLLPDCLHSGVPVESITLTGAELTRAVKHPTSGVVMSVSR